MSHPPYLSDALSSLSQSASILRSLSFTSRAVLPPCVLSSDDWFETHLIRDAATHELALFDPNPASYPVVQQLEVDDLSLLADQEAHRLAVAKRKAPKRANLAQDAVQHSPAGKPGTEKSRNQPERCLQTAQKLLNVYAMPRAQEHVEALHSQLVGLMESITATEQALKRPPSRTAPQPQHDQSYYRQLELMDEIKREKLELLALEQIKADKQAEIEALAAATAAAKAKSAPSKPTAAGIATKPRSSLSGPSTSQQSRPTRTPRTSAAAAASSSSSPRKSSPPRAASPARAPDLATSSPARRPIGRPSVPSVQSAMKRRVEAARLKMQGTPARRVAEKEGEATPRAVAAKDTGGGAEADLLAAGVGGTALPPPVPVVPAATTTTPSTSAIPLQKKEEAAPKLPAGVSPSDLELANKTIWSTFGEVGGLRGWGRKWRALRREREEGQELEKEKEEKEEGGWSWRETLDILAYALSESTSTSAASANAPASPSSHSITSFATSTTTGGTGADDHLPTWSPAQVVEAKLCYLLLATFAGRETETDTVAAGEGEALPPLKVILRETAIPLSTTSSLATSPASSRKTPHLAMASLKSHLGEFAKRRLKLGTEEMGTTAIYALVSRQTVRIDRRGREGAAVGIKAVDGL